MDFELFNSLFGSPEKAEKEERSSKKRSRSYDTNVYFKMRKSVSGKKNPAFEMTTSSSQASGHDQTVTRRKVVFRDGFVEVGAGVTYYDQQPATIAIDENDYQVLQEFGLPTEETAQFYVGFLDGDWDRRVYSLSSMRIISSVPSSICQLASLQYLDLGSAEGLSQLPVEIGDVRSLRTLLLGWSGIVSLPSSIGRLKNLEELNLHNTRRLSQLPDEICNLNSLRILQLHHSVISALPPRIGNLKSLETLSLEYNTNISSLPSSIGQLENLTNLNLYHTTSISHFPKEIFNLSKLITLDLEDTKISSLPPSIGQMKNLTTLYLGGTKNLTALPDEIGDLSNLTVLTINGSNISLLPNSLCKLRNLNYLIVCGGFGINEKKVSNEYLLMLAERYPQVVQLVEHGIYNCRKVKYTLACNCARLNVGLAMTGIPKALWPLIFHSPKNAFRKGPPLPLRFKKYGKISNRIPEPDAIYWFLLEGRGTFMNILNNRKRQE